MKRIKGNVMDNNKAFDEWWGDRGDKWNGKLDIKNFAQEVWNASCNLKDSIIQKLAKELDKQSNDCPINCKCINAKAECIDNLILWAENEVKKHMKYLRTDLKNPLDYEYNNFKDFIQNNGSRWFNHDNNQGWYYYALSFKRVNIIKAKALIKEWGERKKA